MFLRIAKYVLFPMIWLDVWLLVLTERACHRFQRLTGKTNYWLASRIDLAVALLFLLAIPQTIATTHSTFVVVDGLLFMWFSYRGLFTWQSKESQAFHRLQEGWMNAAKFESTYLFIRLWFLYLAVFWLGFCLYSHLQDDKAVTILNALFALYFYLDSCDPLPPCRGTFSLRNLFTALRPVPQV
jgi:hypothetical protein